MSDTNANVTADLEQKRLEEDQQRKADAMQAARALSTLLLGESLTVGPEASVMAVPGGWVFYKSHKAGITGTFVPQPTQRPPTPTITAEPGIILPS
jgi:hypothetical protein